MKYIKFLMLLSAVQLCGFFAIAQVPACIQHRLSQTDSLLKAGVISVQSVKIAGRTMYYFERPVPKLKGADRGINVVFYDTACTPYTFFVGGIAGVVVPKDFTAKDYFNRKVTGYLWTAAEAANNKEDDRIENSAEKLNFFTTAQRYQVISTDSLFPFKKGDLLTFSAANGLYHYRGNRMINRYKIIPEKAIETFSYPCLVAPCPVSRRYVVALRAEPLGGYLKMTSPGTRSFLMICKTKAQKKEFSESDWTAGIELKQL